jgi:hypothetical protein
VNSLEHGGRRVKSHLGFIDASSRYCGCLCGVQTCFRRMVFFKITRGLTTASVPRKSIVLIR